MSIHVRCNCGKEYSVKDELAGKKLRCKACGAGVAIRLATKSAGTTSSRLRSKATSSDRDEFDDLDFAAFGSTAGPGLPPRRSSLKAAASPPPESRGPSSSTGGGTLEERIAARAEEEVEANTRKAPWKELLSAVIFFVIGAGAFYYLDAREQAGGVVRLPRILMVVYLMIGKYGVLAICWGISLLSFVAAGLAFGGFIRIYHADDE